MNDIGLETLIILLLILVNGMFAMAEMALVSARRSNLQARADDGEQAAQTALNLTATPNRLLSTVQVGITLIGVMTGAFGGNSLARELSRLLAQIPALESAAPGIALALVVLGITFLTLVVGELIPKRLALADPERTAMSLAGPMTAIAWLTAPLVRLLSLSTDLGLRLLGSKPHSQPSVSEEEIKILMEEGTQRGVFETVEQDMVASVFRMSDRTVNAVMTPRTGIEWLDLDCPLDENLSKVLSGNHTRYPVCQGNLDNINGVLEAKTLLANQLSDTQKSLADLLEAPLYVPENTPAFRVLEQLRTNHQHLALVIDEYGGLLGLVTLFDMLQSIIGEITDSRTTNDDQQVVLRPDGSWLMDGLLPIDVVKETLELDEMPDEERVGYQTLGGFMMSQLGTIPATGQTIESSGFQFEVVDMDGHRVDKVLITPKSDSASSTEKTTA